MGKMGDMATTARPLTIRFKSTPGMGYRVDSPVDADNLRFVYRFLRRNGCPRWVTRYAITSALTAGRAVTLHVPSPTA